MVAEIPPVAKNQMMVYTDASKFLDIAQRKCRVDDTEEHQRNDNHLDQLDKQISNELEERKDISVNDLILHAAHKI